MSEQAHKIQGTSVLFEEMFMEIIEKNKTNVLTSNCLNLDLHNSLVFCFVCFISCINQNSIRHLLIDLV